MKISFDSDIQVDYHNGIFRIEITKYKLYKPFYTLVLWIYHYLMKIKKLEQAFKLLKIYHWLPVIKIKNKKHPGEVYEFSLYKSDDLYSKLFDLQKDGLRCKLDFVIPCIQEDILLIILNEKDID